MNHGPWSNQGVRFKPQYEKVDEVTHPGQFEQFKIFSVRASRKFDITKKAPSYEPSWAPELTIMRYQMPRNIYSGNQFVKNLISRFQNSQKPLTRSRSRVAQG